MRRGAEFFGVFEEMVTKGIGEARPGTVPWLPELYPVMAQGQMDELNPVLRAAEEVGSPILELGCGTGRLLLPLARKGYQVTGVESNPRMLEILNSKLESAPERVRKRVQILESDMREFSTPTRFKLAFLSANTFLYLVTPQNQRKVVQLANRHLETGGLLLVDTYLPADGWGSEEPYCRTAYDRQTGQFVLYISQAIYNRLAGATLMNAASFLFQKGEFRKAFVQSWEEASLTPKETWLMLEGCGFEVIGMQGDYDGGPVTSGSAQVVTIARKVAEA